MKQSSFYAFAIGMSNIVVGSVFAQKKIDNILKSVKALKGSNPLKIRILYPEGSLANIKPVADSFEKNTGVKIDFLEASVDDINTKMFIDTSREKTDFDIALPATFGIPDLVEAGALADISGYAKKYEEENNYQKSLYDIGDHYKHKKYGYQTDGDSYLMFYHKEWMQDKNYQQKYEDKYGKKLALPKNWEELDQLMAFFHKPEESKYGGCLFRLPRYMVWEWWIRFHAKGCCPANSDMTPNIDDEHGIKALEELIEVSQYLHPSVNTNGLFDNWKEYAKGHCFANIGWGGTQKYLNSSSSAMKGKMLHASTPQVAYFNWGWNYVVSSYSRHKEISYLFCLYATMPEMSSVAVTANGFFDPFREEHYKNKNIEKTYSSSFLDAHEETLKNSIPDFYIQGRGRYIDALQEAILSAYKGYVKPSEALKFAARKWNKITDEIGRDSQIEQWHFLMKQYPKSFQPV